MFIKRNIELMLRPFRVTFYSVLANTLTVREGWFSGVFVNYRFPFMYGVQLVILLNLRLISF